MSRSIWAQLGIEPTKDRTAIRRAYSGKLKAIDVDADPAAFIALREAYERATWEAQFDDEPDYDEDEDEVGEPASAEVSDYAFTGTNDDLFLADDVAPEPPCAEPVAEREGVPEDAGLLRDEEIVAQASTAPVMEGELAADLEAEARREADYRRLHELIHGDLPRESIYVEVAAITLRLLNDPKMEELEHAGAIERWMAERIVTGIPRTNAMLAPTIDYFGWAKMADEWHCPPVIQQVIARHRDCMFADRLENQSDGLGTGYRILSAPQRTYGLRAEHIGSVSALLGAIRTYHPTVEYNLDRDTVAAWEAYIERRKNSWQQKAKVKAGAMFEPVRRFGAAAMGRGWVLTILGIMFFRLVASIAADSDAPVYPSSPPSVTATAESAQAPVIYPRLEEERADIDRALGTLFGGQIDAEKVKQNASLYTALQALWRKDKADDVMQDGFAADVSDLVEKRLDRAVPLASYTLTAARQRERLAQARSFGEWGGHACADLLEGKGAGSAVPEAHRKKMQRIYADILAESGDRAPTSGGDGRFSIPGPIFDAARGRSGLTDALFADALLGKGKPDDRCAARIALIETLLARPAGEALELLRKV